MWSSGREPARKVKASYDSRQAEIVPVCGGGEYIDGARLDDVDRSGDGRRRHDAARRRADLRYGEVQGELGPHGGDRPERPDGRVERPEQFGDADALRDRRWAADRPRLVGAQDGRPVGDTGAEPDA